MMRKFIQKDGTFKYFIWGIKVFFMAIMVWLVLQSFLTEGLRPYYSYKNYKYQNDFSNMGVVQDETEVSQRFISKGTILTNITVYLGDSHSQDLVFTIENALGKALDTVTIDTSDYNANAWNTISIDCNELEKDKEYALRVSSASGLDMLCFNVDHTNPDIFLDCLVSDGVLEGTLAVGFQFTWRYLSVGSIFEMLFKIIFCILMLLAACFAICKFEVLYRTFWLSGKKQGMWYAVFFSVSFTLLLNPLNSVQNEVNSFRRVIGIGLANNVDVAERISNFNHWFFILAVSFVLFFLFANNFMQAERGEEGNKMKYFADNFIVLANVHLVFRCVTYFQNKSADVPVFYYSTYFIMLVMMVVFAYLVLQLEKGISVDMYVQLLLIAFSLSYPIAIIMDEKWQSGKLLLGIQAVAFLCCIFFAKLGRRLFENEKMKSGMKGMAISFSIIPFGTSFYIELINILNQHSVFVANLRKYYSISVLLGGSAAIFFCMVAYKRKWVLEWWKKWSYPVLLFGISCLSVQVALENTYNAHMYETANSSILISDFLNFGSVPLVEHYGGHMMTGVWEGIIYALLNNDVAGAIFTPYGVYIKTVLIVLFFYFLKCVWEENVAFFITLLFPFYQYWQYFGLSMLICLAIIVYMKKNSNIRAAVVWLAFIWCTIYRLDLGTASGIACIISLVIYVISYKNWNAAKELFITLSGWVILGSVVWFSICMGRGINPVKRLLEFLMISLSNQNWAYETIGDTGNMVFAWMYIILPFIMVVCLSYTVFSKKMKEEIGTERWMLLLFMGVSFFGNFSRGLVRHSLCENPINATIVIIWSAYVFLALFFSCLKNNQKLFLPIFTVLILYSTLLIQNQNFTGEAVVDASVSRIGTFTDTWLARGDEREVSGIEKTYWKQIQEKGKAVTRVKWDKTLDKTIYPYRLVIDTLLEKDETFVDFINKSFLYSAINRKNPVYVSQSPIQLSGEYTQEQFVKEIEGVPLVLMPLEVGYDLDGIPSFYRYYKLVEYIYQNYVPLCKYGNSFAIWCLPERYEDMKKKVGTLVYDEEDYQENLIVCEGLTMYGCELEKNLDSQQITVISKGGTASVDGIQNCIDLQAYVGTEILLSMDYKTNIAGDMKIFYTSEEGEEYMDDKVVSRSIKENGTADFLIPVTNHTKIKLVIPEGGVIDICSLRVQSPCEMIEYGYDGPYVTNDVSGNKMASYIGMLHNYYIYQLPQIWAEKDKRKAAENLVVDELINRDGIFIIDNMLMESKRDSNYLLISAGYTGVDQELFYSDDETLEATVKLGHYEKGEFTEKCQYRIVLKEGYHDYLIRVSSDYYWYLGEINAAYIQTNGTLYRVSMKILEGD